MNAGLGTLTDLKRELLAAALLPGKTYDAKLLSIGLGVARSFDQSCNRRLTWAEGDTVEFPADHDCYVAMRYPLTAVSKLELRDFATNDWRDISELIFNWDPAGGLVRFGGMLGSDYFRARLTFSGGYWFDDSDDGSGTAPAGAALLPDDLRLAWLLACRAVWEPLDKTGAKITAVGSGAAFVTGTLSELKYPPAVMATLGNYRRYQMG